ncbi:MAG TPA: hypothetical protein VOA88_01115 [Candidatus Dormibacteraeota bacterium]|nr:hypothetical protein [Candidatus Dormibacteraeota bacterium]
MPTALAAESIIKQFMAEVGLDSKRFCAIVGVNILNQSRLSLAFGDIKPLDQNQATAALRTISQLKDLIALCEPLPISLKDPALVRRLLSAQAAGKLFIDVKILEEDWAATEE